MIKIFGYSLYLMVFVLLGDIKGWGDGFLIFGGFLLVYILLDDLKDSLANKS